MSGARIVHIFVRTPTGSDDEERERERRMLARLEEVLPEDVLHYADIIPAPSSLGAWFDRAGEWAHSLWRAIEGVNTDPECEVCGEYIDDETVATNNAALCDGCFDDMVHGDDDAE